MNFFVPQCQEPPLNHTEFGLCDDENGMKAYTNLDKPHSWIAIVKNKEGTLLTFTAIDKCVIKNGEEVGRGRCDAMITSNEHLYFVELKDQMGSWISDAIDQLESTIKFFRASHDVKAFRHKKAFACNKKHKRFKKIDNERNLKFFREYGFRLDTQAEIIVL